MPIVRNLINFRLIILILEAVFMNQIKKYVLHQGSLNI